MFDYCGLDFGTSNSTIGVPTPESCDLITMSQDGGKSPPSAIFFNYDQAGVVSVEQIRTVRKTQEVLFFFVFLKF